MRKLIIVAAGSLAVFGAGWCFGQQNAWNGTRWKTLNRSERTTYVFGFNRGHAAGMLEGFKEILGVITAARPASSWTPEEIKIMKEKAEQIEQESAGNSGLTMAQLEATVSAFYDVPEYARLLG